MNVGAQIQGYIVAQPEAKQRDLQTLHELVLSLMPDCRLWFLDGRNSKLLNLG
ncbi:MAG: hypothetical protein H6510_14720 [Acidobacteria bacterium]|nr:hypothetical protein [Acidobacteriota bacterium]MCB9399065.1 hypothetical protein [Acidobacteriota bacterium]